MEVEVLPDVELAVQRVLLGDHADQLLGQGGVRYHVDVADEGVPRRRDHSRGEHARRRGLARPVRPEEPEDLPGTDDEVEAVDGGEVRAGIDLGQLDGADDAISRAVGHDLRG